MRKVGRRLVTRNFERRDLSFGQGFSRDFETVLRLKAVADPGSVRMYLGREGSASIFFPQLIDDHAQVLRLFAIIRTPHGLQQAGGASAAFLDWQPGVSGHRIPSASDAPRWPRTITSRLSKSMVRSFETNGGRASPGRIAPQRRANTRQQLFNAERLHHVIVGAGIQRRALCRAPHSAPSA